MKKQLTLAFLACLCLWSVGTAQTFEEISQSVGIDVESDDFANFGGGGAFFDYDGDGDEDLYITGGRQSDHLFQNNGDGTFTDVTFQAGLAITAEYFTSAVVTGDINNDGFREIFVCTWIQLSQNNIFSPSLFFMNNGDGTFTEMATEIGITEMARSMGAVFVDIDNDSFLDLYVINYIDEPNTINSGGQVVGFAHDCFANFFYHNNGDGTFTEMAAELNLDDEGCALAVATTNMDEDDDTDIYVANDFGQWVIPNPFFENLEGTNEFEDIGPQNQSNIGLYGMGIAIGDYDLDQDLDMYISNLGRNVLLRNDGGTFIDFTTEAGVEDEWVEVPFRSTSWGTAFIDYDNNLYEDLFVSNGYIPAANFIATSEISPNKLYHNNEDGTFEDVSTEEGFDNINICRGLAYADYDQDGDVDVFVSVITEGLTEEEHVQLYRNNLDNENNWMQIQLVGVDCNRDAIGSQIRVFVDDKVLIREVRGGSSHASHNSTIAHFGLGTYEEIDSVRINWIGGEPQTVIGLPINQRHTITQGIDPFVDITFELNTNPIEVDPAGIFVFGNGELNAGQNQLLDEDGDGVYSLTKTLPRNFSGQYIFTNGNCMDLSCAEDLSDQPCADAENNNFRSLDNIVTDTTIAACFGFCDTEACLMNFDSIEITFELNMAPVIPAESGVYLAGGTAFGEPGDFPMVDPDGDGIYTLTIRAEPGLSSHYTFTNGLCPDYSCKEDISNQACADPDNFNDRFLEDIQQDTTIEVCFSSCDYDFCFMNFDSVNITFELNMTYQDVSPEGVYLATQEFGNLQEMTDPDGDEVYSITLRQPVGFNTYYTFTNGNCPDLSCRENISGQPCAQAVNFYDRLLPLVTNDTIIQSCFSECSDDLMCTPPVEPTMVTFMVDMRQQEVSNAGVYLGADFDNWSGNIALQDDDEDGIWSTIIPLNPGTYEYKFINGGPGFNGVIEDLDPETDGDCTITNGIFTNRVMTVIPGMTTMELDSVCFGSCSSCIISNTTKPNADWSVQVVPTIAQDQVWLLFRDPAFAEKNIRVFASSGQLIFEDQLFNQSGPYNLATAKWPDGLYVVQIQRGREWVSKRIIVQH